MDFYYFSVNYKATKTNTFIEPELRGENEIFYCNKNFPLTNEINELLNEEDFTDSCLMRNPEKIKLFNLPYEVIKHEDNIHSTIIGYEIRSVYLMTNTFLLIQKMKMLENKLKQLEDKLNEINF